MDIWGLTANRWWNQWRRAVKAFLVVGWMIPCTTRMVNKMAEMEGCHTRLKTWILKDCIHKIAAEVYVMAAWRGTWECWCSGLQYCLVRIPAPLAFLSCHIHVSFLSSPWCLLQLPDNSKASALRNTTWRAAKRYRYIKLTGIMCFGAGIFLRTTSEASFALSDKFTVITCKMK